MQTGVGLVWLGLSLWCVREPIYQKTNCYCLCKSHWSEIIQGCCVGCFWHYSTMMDEFRYFGTVARDRDWLQMSVKTLVQHGPWASSLEHHPSPRPRVGWLSAVCTKHHVRSVSELLHLLLGVCSVSRLCCKTLKRSCWLIMRQSGGGEAVVVCESSDALPHAPGVGGVEILYTAVKFKKC